LREAVLIREEAILTDLDTKYVLVVSKGMYQPTDRFNQPLKGADGKPVPPYEAEIVKRQDVKIGRLLDSQLRVVKEGLQPGEHYIVKGVQRVRIGMEVQPITLHEYDARRAAEGGTKAKDEETKKEKNEPDTK
jgi:multidrug efflux pump subunit AcrA (membrane-fusion protein)